MVHTKLAPMMSPPARLSRPPTAIAQPYLSAGWPRLTLQHRSPDASGCAVVGAADVVDRGAETEIAPGLVDAQVGDDVRNPEAVVVGALIGEAVVGGSANREGCEAG